MIALHAWGSPACDAMMQEIAPQGGNFCGVCPFIGRLNASLRWRISPGRENGRRLSANFHAPE